MNTRTWLVWLGAALLVVALTNNPLYLVLVLLLAVLVFVAWRDETRLARAYPLFFGLGALLWLAYVLWSVVTVGGARGTTVLATLPSLTLPPLLGGITLGGPITAEDLVWGALRGLRIWVLLAVFGAFNALVDHYRLLRLTPRSLFHAGLIVTIGVSFVPQTVRAIAEIGEAQRVRGHRFRGLRSYLPLVSPLLAGSLERSIQLAEALDARGYGRTTAGAGDPSAQRAQQIGAVLSALLLGGGLFTWLYYGAGVASGGLLLTGGLLLLGTLWATGRSVTRSTYRRERWRRRDTVALGAACLLMAGWAALWALDTGGLRYNPYPVAALPRFSPLAGALLLGLAAPALLTPARAERQPARSAKRRARRAADRDERREERKRVDEAITVPGADTPG